MNTLLETRDRIKARKPHFKRHGAGKRKRLSMAWRAKKTRQNKIGRIGHQKKVKIGWSSPRLIRGTTSQGLFPVMVSTIKDLTKINVKTDGAVIAAAVGAKKKAEIIKAAIEKKIQLVNVKDAKSTIDNIAKRVVERKAKREEFKKKKAAVAKKATEKKQEKESKEESKDETEKKEEGVKQQEKVITKRQ